MFGFGLQNGLHQTVRDQKVWWSNLNRGSEGNSRHESGDGFDRFWDDVWGERDRKPVWI